jgi:hypothetical protein
MFSIISTSQKALLRILQEYSRGLNEFSAERPQTNKSYCADLPKKISFLQGSKFCHRTSGELRLPERAGTPGKK